VITDETIEWHKHLDLFTCLLMLTQENTHILTFSLLPPTKEEVHVFARVCLSVCLSVCLLARLFRNTCMDLGEMLRVDKCRDMDERINF